MKPIRPKQLISKYLAAFLVLVLFTVLGLQIASQFHSKANFAKASSETELILTAATPAQPSQSIPDFKISNPWISNTFEGFQILGPPSRHPGFAFHPLQKLELMRLLMATISINAP